MREAARRPTVFQVNGKNLFSKAAFRFSIFSRLRDRSHGGFGAGSSWQAGASRRPGTVPCNL